MTEKIIPHHGYTGTFERDPDDGMLHGRVDLIRDVALFAGRTHEETQAAFVDSVDDYLEMCVERGEQPEPPPSA